MVHPNPLMHHPPVHSQLPVIRPPTGVPPAYPGAHYPGYQAAYPYSPYQQQWYGASAAYPYYGSIPGAPYASYNFN